VAHIRLLLANVGTGGVQPSFGCGAFDLAFVFDLVLGLE
jgi:hypothetical protein